MAKRDHTILVAAFLLAILLSFIGLSSSSISLHDEARVAGIGRQMLDSGNYVAPYLRDPALGHPFLEKPPLYFWSEALSFKLFGFSDWAARAPSGLFAFLSLLLAFAIGTHLEDRRAGLLTVLVLGTSFGFFDVMHRCLVDPALIFAVTLGTLGFLLSVDPGTEKSRRLGLVLWGIAIPLSWFAKGVAGPAFTAGAPVLTLLAARRFKLLFRAWPAAAIAAGLGVVTIGPYLLALGSTAGSQAVKELVFGQTFARILGPKGGGPSHAEPFWYYLAAGPTRILPWLFVLPALFKSHVLRGPKASGRRALIGFAVFGFLLLSVSSDKRGIYLVPIIPALAGVVGVWLAGLGRIEPGREWDRLTSLFLLAVFAAVPAVVAVALFGLRFIPIHSKHTDMAWLAKGVGPSMLIAVGVVGVAGTFWLVRSFRSFRRTGRTPGPAFLLAPLIVFLLAYQVVGLSLHDRVETARPLMDEVAKVVPAKPGHLLLLKGRESLVGFVYFDLGRQVRNAGNPKQLEALLARDKGRFVLGEARKFAELPGRLRDHLRLLYEEPHRRRHPYGLYRWD